MVRFGRYLFEANISKKKVAESIVESFASAVAQTYEVANLDDVFESRNGQICPLDFSTDERVPLTRSVLKGRTITRVFGASGYPEVSFPLKASSGPPLPTDAPPSSRAAVLDQPSQALISDPMEDLVEKLGNSQQFQKVISNPYPHLHPPPYSVSWVGKRPLSVVFVDLPLCRIATWKDKLPPTWATDLEMSVEEYRSIKNDWPFGIKRLSTRPTGEYLCRTWSWVRLVINSGRNDFLYSAFLQLLVAQELKERGWTIKLRAYEAFMKSMITMQGDLWYTLRNQTDVVFGGFNFAGDFL